jgi:hypothetical protein
VVPLHQDEAAQDLDCLILMTWHFVTSGGRNFLHLAQYHIPEDLIFIITAIIIYISFNHYPESTGLLKVAETVN